MRKPRVLLVTAFHQRDLGTCYVIASVLEKLGCNSFVASQGRGRSFHMRAWRPDAVFCMRMSALRPLMECYPVAKFFYCPGEGGEQYVHAEEKDLVEDNGVLSRLNRAFLWGQKSVDNIRQKIEEDGANNLFPDIEGLLNDKISVLGHPRADLARFAKAKPRAGEKIRIGFVGSFSLLNHASGTSLLSKILNTPEGHATGLFQLKLANTYRRVISELDLDRYTLSLRPYVSEFRAEYLSMKFVRQFGIDIDESMDFGTWASQQDLIIGPTSSTIPQIVMANRPCILVDFVDNEPEQSVYRISLSRLFHQHLPDNLPKSFEQLMTMIDDYQNLPVTTDGLNEILEQVYNLSPAKIAAENPPSVLGRIAASIHRDLTTASKPRPKPDIPCWIAALIDQHYYSVTDRSYNDFSFGKIRADLGREFDPVVTAITQDDGWQAREFTGPIWATLAGQDGRAR